jgi:hypothetical protein
VSATTERELASETGALFKSCTAAGKAVGSFQLGRTEDVWNAVRHFFQQQAEAPVL